MNISKISPDDPRLTAYALGELEGDEHAAIEAAIKNDPAAQAAVAQIRALSGELSAALAKEPVAAGAPDVAEQNDADEAPAPDPYVRRKIVRFPYFIIAGLAAACFAVMFVVQQESASEQQQTLAFAKIDGAKASEAVASEAALPSSKNETVYQIALDQAANEARIAAMPSPAEVKTFPDQKLLPTSVSSVGSGVPPSIAVAAQGQLNGSESDKRTDMWPETVVLPTATIAVEKERGYGAAISAPPIGKASSFVAAGVRGAIPAVPTKKSAAREPQVASNDGYDVVKLDAFSVSAEREGSRARRNSSALMLRGETDIVVPSAPAFNTEAYAYSKDNDYLEAAGNPLSTFSIDVDTASYANVRRFLNNNSRPPRDAVRIEELVNYFPYRYAAPKDDAPFAASMEVAAAPWNPQHRLVRIGLKGREVAESQRPSVSLVFLLDVSGSMNQPNKLPLVKESMRLLIEKLKPTDRVAITVYAGASGLALPSTEVAKKKEILAALDALSASGSTNGALGIQLAYDIAKANSIPGAANRVVLCTDGDFNVGVTNEGELTRLIEEKAKSGVFLTVLGFGMGNYKDATLEKLADKGNGNYGYIDTATEAKKLLVDQLSGTLVTIAKDVKLQVEFNPALVQSYRLIGYENRLLKKEDFNNDKIDAGEIGAGHTVTALYEIVPVGVEPAGDAPAVDALKYQTTTGSKRAQTNHSPELLTLKIRYKNPDAILSRKLEFPLVDSGAAFDGASQDFKFAAAVAGFGMLLRESPHKGAATFDSVLGWAEDGTGDDAGGYRHEFIALVKKAKDGTG